MFEKLTFIEERYEELSKKISDPEVIADNEAWRKLCKEHSDITPIVEKYREYKRRRKRLRKRRRCWARSVTRTLRNFCVRKWHRRRLILSGSGGTQNPASAQRPER